MPIITRPEQYHEDDLYLDASQIFGHRLLLKCEGLNFAGSIKLKAAARMVADAEASGMITPGSILVESSSGNMGIALAMIAASAGYRFLCVTDPHSTTMARRIIEAVGGEVVVIAEPHPRQGYLGSRLDHVRSLCAADSRYVWLRQRENPSNWIAHARSTAPAIYRRFPDLRVLFVGAGTTGTLMGCARFLRESAAGVRIVAVDSEGSVTFGGPPGRRLIPGLGASVRPPILDADLVDEVIHVPEVDAIATCRRMAAAGFLFGGSTGTVVSGALRWLAANPTPTGTCVAIAPDLGERYLESVYDDAWVSQHFGEELAMDAARV